jgi:transposase InsO family protein
MNMDLCSRKVISWAFSDKPNTELTIRAISLAVNKRQPNDDVIADSIDYIEPFYHQRHRYYKL